MTVDRLQFANASLQAEVMAGLGGRLSRLRFCDASGHWQDVLVPIGMAPAEPPRWPKGGAYPLMPYSNRIRDARLQQGAHVHQLTPHPDATPHTLHGIAHLRVWHLADLNADNVRLIYRHEPDTHWPWAFSAEQRFTLGASTLRVDLAITNTAPVAAPAGLGWHPYFMISGAPDLRFRAAVEWPQDDANLPAGDPQPHAAASIVLDAKGGTRYFGGWDGVLSFATGSGLRVQITADAAFAHLVVHRPALIDYLCVEPVSHVADGFNLAARGIAGTGTKILQPGETFTGALTLQLA